MLPRPAATEAESSYFRYINLITGDDPLAVLEKQLNEPLLSKISEKKSLHRYAPDKWSIRQVLNHVTDTERSFAYRMLWFARGFDAPLESYDQTVAAAGAEAEHFLGGACRGVPASAPCDHFSIPEYACRGLDSEWHRRRQSRHCASFGLYHSGTFCASCRGG